MVTEKTNGMNNGLNEVANNYKDLIELFIKKECHVLIAEKKVNDIKFSYNSLNDIEKIIYNMIYSDSKNVGKTGVKLGFCRMYTFDKLIEKLHGVVDGFEKFNDIYRTKKGTYRLNGGTVANVKKFELNINHLIHVCYALANELNISYVVARNKKGNMFLKLVNLEKSIYSILTTEENKKIIEANKKAREEKKVILTKKVA